MTPDGMDTKRSSATKSENKEVLSICHKNDIGHFFIGWSWEFSFGELCAISTCVVFHMIFQKRSEVVLVSLNISTVLTLSFNAHKV